MYIVNKRNIASGMSSLCLADLEHSRCRILSCSMARMVWGCINVAWMSLIRVKLSSFKWGFASFPKCFWVIEVLGDMVQLEYVECLNYWFTRSGEKISHKVKKTSSVAIGSVRDVTKSQLSREPTTQGGMSSCLTSEFVVAFRSLEVHAL